MCAILFVLTVSSILLSVEAMNISEAKEWCQKKRKSSLPKDMESTFWTGLNDQASEGEFRWLSTGNAKGQFSNWAPGRPGSNLIFENCV
ncbi:hypothetical protein B566_EDAN015360, partial [Ephemera danica]